MLKACLALAFFCLVFVLPARAFDWETATVDGRDYVTLRSFCTFYGFDYLAPSGNQRFVSRSAAHSISFKLGNGDIYLDGVHYVLSFPIEGCLLYTSQSRIASRQSSTARYDLRWVPSPRTRRLPGSFLSWR